MTKRIEGMQDPKLDPLQELARHYEVYPEWPHLNFMKLDMLQQIVEIEQINEGEDPTQ